MADLSVNLCGMKLKNPVMPAAGPPVRNADCILECVKGGAGCIVTKTVSTVPADVPRPCMSDLKGSFMNTELWSENSVEHWVENEYERCREAGVPVIISIGYTADQIEKLVPMVSEFADALEVSTHYVGKDMKPIADSLHAAMKSGLPVFMKLSPGIPDMAQYAKILEREGASGIVAINSVGPCLSIDAETCLPIMGSSTGYGWLSGKAIKPIAMRCVYEVASAVKIPVVAAGGISNGIDAIEMMMAGASAIQACTSAILEGPSVYGKIAGEMEEWLDSHEHDSVQEIIGLAARKMQSKAKEFVRPVVIEEKCKACGICARSCAYQAISIDAKASIDENLCFRCGLCKSRCPSKAIEFIDCV